MDRRFRDQACGEQHNLAFYPQRKLIGPMLRWIVSLPCSQQGGQHRLQSPDQEIGFLVALQERGDLRIFHADLVAQKNILTFESRDILLEAIGGLLPRR